MTHLRIALAVLASTLATACPADPPSVDAGRDAALPGPSDAGVDATSDAPISIDATPDVRSSLDAPESLDSFSLDAPDGVNISDTSHDARGAEEDAPTSDAFLVTGTAAAPMPGMLACVGSQRMPSAGAPLSGVLAVSATGLTTEPVSASIQVHQGAAFGATCTAPLCSTVTTDALGQATLVLPSGSWFAYRVPPTTANVLGLGFFSRWSTSASGTTTIFTLSPTASAIVTSGLNRELDATKSGITGSVSDCSGSTLANVRIRMFRGATEIISGAPADIATPRISGVGDTAIPRPTVTGRTSFMGRFAAVIPTGGDVRIEAWGTRMGASVEELISCEVVSVEPNGFTLAALGPYRNDYAVGHGCIGRRAP